METSASDENLYENLSWWIIVNFSLADFQEIHQSTKTELGEWERISTSKVRLETNQNIKNHVRKCVRWVEKESQWTKASLNLGSIIDTLTRELLRNDQNRLHLVHPKNINHQDHHNFAAQLTGFHLEPHREAKYKRVANVDSGSTLMM